MTDVATLDRWIDAARAIGRIAIDAETNSLDPMRAEIAGVSLALEPGRAAYVPINHKSGTGDLLGGGLVEGQIPAKTALAKLKALLEDPSVIKIAQNLKYDYVVFSRHGIDVAPYDDTMLISYALDGGKGGSGMDALASDVLGHTPISFKDVAGAGQKQVTFDQVALDKATEYSAEDADVAIRLWSALKPRLTAERMMTVYETLERPLIPVLARMEARGIKGRPPDPVAHVRRIRAEARRAGARDLSTGRREFQHRLAEAARRHSLRKVRSAGRNEDQDRRVVD